MKRALLIPLFLLLMTLTASAQDPEGVMPLPVLDELIQITDWWVVGPFLGGPREPLANPFAGAYDYETGEVDLSMTFPSEQEYGGEVSWQTTTVDEEGNLVISFDNADWEKINDEWGVSGVYFTAAAYSTFHSTRACRAIVNANGIGSFYINGRQYSGDPYGHGLIQTPVILDAGENTVFFMSGGWGGGDSVKFEILPPPETELIILERDLMFPDYIVGQGAMGPAGIPILNTTERWIRDVSILCAYDDVDTMVNAEAILAIPPLSVIKVPIDLYLSASPLPEDIETLEIPVHLDWPDGHCESTATIRVRNAGESQLRTFRSEIDGSVQKYGVLWPTDYHPGSQYALILTTHGAGVECEGQVNAFAAKDWAFVVAPTNRRRFGFDWQDWGRLDAMEVLDIAMEAYPIDPNRVYLIGHSMGGHGAWHIGCTHAERFAAVVPSAGWASFQLYVPWFLRHDEMFRDPDCARIFEQCTSPDRTERLLPNLRNTPLLAVHGAEDDNVPPTHARMLTGFLDRMGYEVSYWEEPGMGHWWDNSPDVPGTDCVDALRIQSFCRERERDPNPRHVTLASWDLGNNNSMYWITVEEEISPIGRIYVDAEITRDGSITVETENVRRMNISFETAAPYRIPESVTIDGQEVDANEWSGDIFLPLVNSDDGWTAGWAGLSDLRKDAEFRGPIKRAYFSPFAIIVGQSGSEEENELNMQIARNLSQRWWYRANGYVQIIRDDEFIRVAPLYGMNFILVGGPESNSLSGMYAAELPIFMERDGIWLGREFIEGEDLACQFVYPRPDDTTSLVHAIWGNSIEGMRMSGGLSCIYSGSNQPDYLIYDEDVRLLGYAGVRAAGFFDNRWQVDPESGYVR